MNPVFEITSEHETMQIVLDAMHKLANQIRMNGQADLFRIGQILDFLHTYADNLHYEKEEKVLFPAIIDESQPWISKTINRLIQEHKTARNIINEIDKNLRAYLDGKIEALTDLSFFMLQYVELERQHIRIENSIILPICEEMLDRKHLVSITMNFKVIEAEKMNSNKYLEYFRLLNKLSKENYSAGKYYS